MTDRQDRAWRGERNHLAGCAAEQRIAQDYEKRGYCVAQRRWRSRSGETDLIVRDDSGIVFVEVKKSRSHAAAAERLSRRQIARVSDAGLRYLSEIGAPMDTEIRFDVALVDATGAFEILENAFAAY